MSYFVPTTYDDEPLIQRWVDADPWHPEGDPEHWWVIGGYLHFKVMDEDGVVAFVRLDREGDLLRFHTKFAPVEEVNEKRVARAIINTISGVKPYAITDHVEGFIIASVAPKLVAFLCKNLGFKPDVSDNVKMMFGEGQ